MVSISKILAFRNCNGHISIQLLILCSYLLNYNFNQIKKKKFEDFKNFEISLTLFLKHVLKIIKKNKKFELSNECD